MRARNVEPAQSFIEILLQISITYIAINIFRQLYNYFSQRYTRFLDYSNFNHISINNLTLFRFLHFSVYFSIPRNIRNLTKNAITLCNLFRRKVINEFFIFFSEIAFAFQYELFFFFFFFF